MVHGLVSLPHVCFFFNHLTLSYISLPVPIKSGHGHRPSLMWRLEKRVWLFLKHVDDETRVHPKTSPEVRNKTRGPTLFFHFTGKEIYIFSVDL